jgi:hypothetical protein
MKLWRPIIQAIDEKHVQIAGINPYLAVCLFELPEVLAKRDHPSAHDRIFPPLTGTDATFDGEWHDLVGPDLRHLFVSAGETVVRDLTSMREDPLREKHMQVIFPVEHVPAWMSAVNEARLILGALHQITEDDMNQEEPNPDDPKTLAILKISILGELMGYLVDFTTGDQEEDNSSPKPKRRRQPRKPKKKQDDEPS